MKSKSYQELIRLKTFDERLDYLRLNGRVGVDTFGSHRYLNQRLYEAKEWKKLRDQIIIRDNGCDLGHPDFLIIGNVYVHHINPITIHDLLENRPCVWDPNNLVSTSFDTHNSIHYGVESIRPIGSVVDRKKYDTCPWKS